jgi:hypothetical protein
MGLTALIGCSQLAGQQVRVGVHLWQDDALRPASDTGHQGQIAAVTTHDFDEKRSLVRRSRHFQSVDGLKRNIQGGIDANGDLRPAQIIVDRRCHANNRKSLLRKSERPSLRPVPTNHDQCVDFALPKKPDSLQLCLLRFELLATFAAEESSASLDDITYVSRPELNEIVFE